MSVSFVCLSNARGYTLDVPGLRDIWKKPCRWQGKGGQHSSKFVALSALDNPTLLGLLETEQLVPDPREHVKVFRNENLPALEAQYKNIFAAHIVVRAKMPAAPAPAAPSVPSPEEMAAKAAEIAAAEAKTLAEAEAVAKAEEKAAAAEAAATEKAAAEAAAAAEESADEAEEVDEPSDEPATDTSPSRPSSKKKRR